MARRVLLSTRDPGGAGHVVVLLEALRARGGCEVLAVASGVALRLLREAGESPRAFALPDGRDCIQAGESAAPLLSAARAVLDELAPDAVVTSASSYGVGVDEALVAEAGVPTFTIQDFWGDVNLGLERPPRLYFVMDDYAVTLTRERWGLPAMAVGSPKHGRYARLDVAGLREATRARHGIGPGQPVVGFFGQAPDIPGHEAAYEALLHAVAGLSPRPRFVLKDHPKFSEGHVAHARAARAHGLDVIDASDALQVEPWLAACDVVVTPFSLSALDHAYLSAFSPAPIGSTLYLLPNPDLQASMDRMCGMPEFPTVARGLGHVARDPARIGPLLASALRPGGAAAYFEASQALRGETTCDRMMDEILRGGA
ncbi:MAG: hypothetical protein AB7H88_04060 [Vicinamibacterales bacterium]